MFTSEGQKLVKKLSIHGLSMMNNTSDTQIISPVNGKLANSHYICFLGIPDG